MLVLSVTFVVLTAPAVALESWKHGGASQSACNSSGCHSNGASISNATNAACQRCWGCHRPGTAPTVGCTGSCHLATVSGNNISYSATFSHGATPHLGASGYGKTCADCHAGGAHHDATAAAEPQCGDCHNGTYAKLPPTSHNDGKHTTCSSCHTGMSIPSGDCASCHVGSPSSGGPQVTYTNDLTCADAACHGKVTNHVGTPIGSAACTTCHAAHYESLGACTTCHADPQAFHHGTATAIPLNSCATCHNGGIASAPTGHGAYGGDCVSCHTGMNRPSTNCASCHVGNPGSGGPQVAYTNDLTCADAACHGKVTNHVGTPIGSAACTTCHKEHYKGLGTCSTCHGRDPGVYHHGTAKATALAKCETCHDGTIATAKQSHAGMSCTACHNGMTTPAVPATCQTCHESATFGSATCTACHSKGSGMFGKREQVHLKDPSVACTTCHKPMYEDVGACATCHSSHAQAHHATATPATTTLKVAVSKKRVKKGTKILVGGTLTGASGPLAAQKVLVQARTSPKAAYKTLSTLTTGSDGKYGRVLRPRMSTQYRVIWQAAGDAGRAQKPAVALVRVKVTRT